MKFGVVTLYCGAGTLRYVCSRNEKIIIRSTRKYAICYRFSFLSERVRPQTSLHTSYVVDR